MKQLVSPNLRSMRQLEWNNNWSPLTSESWDISLFFFFPFFLKTLAQTELYSLFLSPTEQLTQTTQGSCLLHIQEEVDQLLIITFQLPYCVTQKCNSCNIHKIRKRYNITIFTTVTLITVLLLRPPSGLTISGLNSKVVLIEGPKDKRYLGRQTVVLIADLS